MQFILSGRKRKAVTCNEIIESKQNAGLINGTHKEDAGREILNSKVDNNKHQYVGSDNAAEMDSASIKVHPNSSMKPAPSEVETISEEVDSHGNTIISIL